MTTALPKKSSTPVVLALIALLLTAGGCLAGTFSGWSYRASETSWDMGGLGSEGRSFGRRLERESREQAAARILPSGFCALCCLGIAALLALVGFHSALNQRDNGVLPLVPLAIAAAAMLFGAVVFAHAGFLSEESERIERLEQMEEDHGMVIGVHTDPQYDIDRRRLLARKLVSGMLCTGAFAGLGLAGVLFVVHRKRRDSAA